MREFRGKLRKLRLQLPRSSGLTWWRTSIAFVWKMCLSNDYIQQTLPVTYTYPFASRTQIQHSRVFIRSRRAVYLRFLRVLDRHDIGNIVSQNSLYYTNCTYLSVLIKHALVFFVYNNRMSNNDWNMHRMTCLSRLRLCTP